MWNEQNTHILWDGMSNNYHREYKDDLPVEMKELRNGIIKEQIMGVAFL